MSQHDFSAKLLHWHRLAGRHDLPWQKKTTAYRVWVAEIMLQQTQVTTVIPYYKKFMASLPSLRKLAQADPEQVLALWSGLGYYRRAHHLQQTARIIRDRHGGRFPRNLATILTLPGIGRSTAGAILSLAFDLAHPILDGNVKRVLCRYHAIVGWPGEKAVQQRLWQLSQQHTQAAANVAVYTQAIMDLGATLCQRNQTRCPCCPLATECKANQQGIQTILPTPGTKKTLQLKHTRMLLLFNPHGQILLQRRPPTGVWPSLWSLPECSIQKNPTHWCHTQLQLRIGTVQHLPKLHHSFTHYKLDIHPLSAKIQAHGQILMDNSKQRWAACDDIESLGMASPIKRLLKQFFNNRLLP